jgi:SAM-dependent methyltransferase
VPSSDLARVHGTGDYGKANDCDKNCRICLIEHPDYWWYRARADLLRSALDGYIRDPRLVLGVGSADGPSVDWLHRKGKHVSLDVDPRGLDVGGICGSALALPFADESFDVVAAFDVVEHCDPEAAVLNELARVLTPGGRLLLSVPAYQWAWTRFDDLSGITVATRAPARSMPSEALE